MAKLTYKNTLEPGLLYGGILGGITVLHSIILYTLDATFSGYAKWGGNLLPIVVLVIALYMYRNEYLKGVMSYSQGLGMGTLIMVIGGIIGMAYSYVFVKYIDPDFINQMVQAQEEAMLQKGMDEASIERAMEFTEKLRSPGVLAIVGLISMLFYGFIASLVISAFLKKEPKDPFAEVK